MNPAAPCSICQEGGHRSSKCPELAKDLQPGFYKPSGGMPQGGGEDDERLHGLRKEIVPPIPEKLPPLDFLSCRSKYT